MFKDTNRSITLNPYFKETTDSKLVVWSHDKNSFKMNMELTSKSCPMLLSGGTPCIMLQFKPKNEIGIYPLIVESAYQGLVSFVVPEQILGFVGEVYAFVYVDFEEQSYDFGSFKFSMEKSAIDGDFKELDEMYVHEFAEAVKKIKEIADEYESKYATAIADDQEKFNIFLAEAKENMKNLIESEGLVTGDDLATAVENINYVGTNLWAPNFYEGKGNIGAIDISTGVPNTNANYIYTDRIALNGANKFTRTVFEIPTLNLSRASFYKADTDDSYISYINIGMSTLGSITVDTPKEANYIRFFKSRQDGKVKVELGNKSTDYSISPLDIAFTEKQNTENISSIYTNVLNYLKATEVVDWIDISEALQQALNNHVKVMLPPGRYTMSKTVSLNEGNIINCWGAVIQRSNPKMYCFLTNGATNFENDKPNTLKEAFDGYAGKSNFKIIGGLWDCNKDILKNGGGFSFAHAKDYSIEDVNIINVYNVHHIEINSSKDVVIKNSTFSDMKYSIDRDYAEAIQVDLAYAENVYPLFGKYDSTVCENILIDNCRFKNVGAGIGTHYFVPGKYNQTNIVNCSFENIATFGVRLKGFKNSMLSNCTFNNCGVGVAIDDTIGTDISSVTILKSKTVGMSLERSTRLKLSSITIDESGTLGMWLDNLTHSQLVVAEITNSKTTNASINNSSDLMLSGLQVENASVHGFVALTSERIKVSDSTITGSGEHNIYLSKANNGQFANVSVHGPSRLEVNKNNIVVTDSDSNRFVNNNVKSNDRANYGIILTGTSKNNIFKLNDLTMSGKGANYNDTTANKATNKLFANEGVNDN